MSVKKFDVKRLIDEAFERLIAKAFGTSVINLWMLDGL